MLKVSIVILKLAWNDCWCWYFWSSGIGERQQKRRQMVCIEENENQIRYCIETSITRTLWKRYSYIDRVSVLYTQIIPIYASTILAVHTLWTYIGLGETELIYSCWWSMYQVKNKRLDYK